MWWRAVAAGVAATLITACSSGNEEAGPTATLRPQAPTTTGDPYAVPEVIDEAYVNRVLEGLDAAVGDINRLVYRTKTIPPEAVDRLRALYTAEFVQIRVDGFQSDMRAGFANYRPDPGNPKTTVTRVITTKPDCLFVEAHRDYGAVAQRADAKLSRLWVGLRPKGSDPSSYNPTPWMFIYDGFQQNLTEPPNPCVG